MRISDWSSDVCSSDLVGPSIPGIEDRAVDARNRDRKFEAEIRVLAEFGVIEATVERRVEQRAGRLDRHTADAVHRGHAAGPAGVDEPALDAALRDALFQQVAIDRRRSEERRGG